MKNKKIFNSKKTIIIINLLLILALMTGSVYSWFAVNVENRVDVYEIEVEADNALELSFTGEENSWSTFLNVSDLKNDKGELVLTNLNFGEITGDGTTFKIPTLSQYGNYALVDKSAEANWSDATENVDFLRFKVHLRSEDQLNVFLSSDSAAFPATDNFKGDNVERPASCKDAKFSKDCIVGALRVAFDDVSSSNDNPNYIWITNPDFHLNNNIGTDDYSMDFDATTKSYTEGLYDSYVDQIINQPYKWNNPTKHYYYDINKTLKDSVANVKVITELPDTLTNPYTSNAIQIASLTGTKGEDGFYHDDVEFTIWLEGCDTEARRALVGGKFRLSLAFDSIAPLA